MARPLSVQPSLSMLPCPCHALIHVTPLVHSMLLIHAAPLVHAALVLNNPLMAWLIFNGLWVEVNPVLLTECVGNRSKGFQFYSTHQSRHTEKGRNVHTSCLLTKCICLRKKAAPQMPSGISDGTTRRKPMLISHLGRAGAPKERCVLLDGKERIAVTFSGQSWVT